MEKGNAVKKQRVLGRLPLMFKVVFYACFAVWTAVFVHLAVKDAEMRKLWLILLCSGDIVFLALSYVVPVFAFYENYAYALSKEAIVLYRKDEKVMELKWADSEVALGSYIKKGSERKPKVCAKAICFTAAGRMRSPVRFPRRALKGAGGELCVAFSKARLRDVFAACGGKIVGDVSADGSRLPLEDAELMASCLEKLRAKAPRPAEESLPMAEEIKEETPSL